MAQVPTLKRSNYSYGKSQEDRLKSRIEAAIGEPLVKTEERWASFDFVSDSHHVELKSRRAPVTADQYETWLLPSCKAPKTDERETLYIYHFEADDSLWFCYYNKDLFDSFEKEKPRWHPTGQEHWLIPRKEWSRV